MSDEETISIRELKRATDPRGDARNVALVVAQLAVHGYLLFGLPLLWDRDRAWALTLVIAGVVPIPMWILVHEAVHGGLHRNKAVNDLLGRLLATVCYAAPYELLRIGHLLHHRDNTYGQIKVDPTRPKRMRWYANYYAGLFLQPVVPVLLSNLLGVLPRRWAIPIARRMATPALLARATEPRAYARICREGMLTLVVVVTSAVVWRSHLPGLLLIYALRCALISFDDSVYHFQGPSDPLHGYNLRVPRALRWMFLGFNYHGVHHHNAGLRWRQLATTFTRAQLRFDGAYLTVALGQLRPQSPVILDAGRDAALPSALDADSVNRG